MYDEMLEEFNQEADELLSQAEEGLILMDKGEDLQKNFDQVYRCLHSLKGAAGMFGLEELKNHFHHLENIFEIANENGDFNALLIDYLLKGLDAAGQTLKGEKLSFEVKEYNQIVERQSPHKENKTTYQNTKRKKTEKKEISTEQKLSDNSIKLSDQLANFKETNEVHYLESFKELLAKHQTLAREADIKRLYKFLEQVNTLVAEGIQKQTTSKKFLTHLDELIESLHSIPLGSEVFPEVQEFDLLVKENEGRYNRATSPLHTLSNPDNIRSLSDKRREIEKAGQTSQKIVIVDDEEDICEIIKDSLESEGYEVYTYTDPTLFLKEFKELECDLIISDYNMPDINGLELTHKVKEHNPLVPVIFVSGYLTVDICIEALSQGASGIVEKPVDFSKLKGMVGHSIQKFEAYKVLNSSISCLAYQFQNLDDYLKKMGQEKERKVMRDQIEEIIQKRNFLKAS